VFRQRIAVVVADFSVGGVQRSAISIAEMLAREHDVTILTPNAVDEIHADTTKVEMVIGDQGTRRDIVARWRRMMWLRRKLAELDPTIAVALTPGPAAMTMAGLASRRSAQVVFFEATDYRTRIDRPMVRVGRILCYRFADAAVVQTSRLAEAVWEGRPKRPVYLIPTALSRIFTPPTGLDHSKQRVLFVGRLVPLKQADQAIDAFVRVARSHPGWTFDIVGDGPCRPQLERQAAASGIGDRITFHGLTDDPSEFYEAASVLLLTSKYEGFGNVIIEAMAFGVPVVSFDCPSGPSAIITQGRSGYLVPPGDVKSMASYLDLLMSDQERLTLMGAFAVDEVAHYSEDRVAPLWLELIADLAARRSQFPQ
jgi:glycosyltransferase involved in cell wall biosynthesis